MSAVLTVVAVLLALACFFVILWSDIRKRRGKKQD
jgi:cell division protein FtsX